MTVYHRILVTGGAGFIGSNLIERLLQQEDVKILNLDNFNDFYNPSIKRSNIMKALENPRYTLVEGDIREEDVVKSIFDSFKPDAVIHLAAMAGVRPSILQPLLYQDVNIRGTMILLENARDAGVEKFLFASSSSVYGNLKEAPFRESANISRPVSPYAATKLAGEEICYTYHHLYGIPVIALRFFTVYGPRQRPEMAIHKFTRAIFEGKTIQLYGDSAVSRRDYTFIEDILDGILSALDSEKKWGIYNLGNSSTVPLGLLVSLLEEIIGKKAIVESAPWQPGDVLMTYADLQKSFSELGYSPRVSIEDGLWKFVSWFRKTNSLSHSPSGPLV